MRSLLCSLFLAASLVKVYAAIGPVASLPIVNAKIAPDGFPRSYVTYSLALWVVTDLRLSRSAVLANGQFPGPLIRGKKVN